MTSFLRISAVVTVIAAGYLSWSSRSGEPDLSSVPEASAAATRAWAESDLWLAPARDPDPASPIGLAVTWLAAGQAADALATFEAARVPPVVAPYVALHRGRAALALDRAEDAAAIAREVADASGSGYLGESALFLLAEALEARQAWGEAVETWTRLDTLQAGSSSAVQLRLAKAAEKGGDLRRALEVYDRLYYERPASAEAREAETAFTRLPVTRGDQSVERELARAARLYDARRLSDAFRAYEAIRGRGTGADRRLVEFRLALCDVRLGRYQRGLTALTAYLAQAPAADRPEAGYYVLTALRGLKRADYPARVARFVRDHATHPLAETALNDLATHYILADEDVQAARVFTEMVAKFPTGASADRASWRAGWWAYRADDYRETIRLFEPAVTAMPRSDYRPSWLYWTARAYEALGQRDTARLWYLRTVADYRNSYYGRQASQAYQALTGTPPPAEAVAGERNPARAIAVGPPPSNAALVRALLDAGLWDDAVAELRRAQAAGSSSPVIEATVAYALNRKGDLRPGITAMRRAYPQFMADGGEALPERLLKVIFPVAHGDTIRRHAESRDLDRYLVTALVAQESTFQADVVSSANAVGLMQLLPSTGRQYARKIGVAGFTPAALVDPETNVRLGTAYLSELLGRYGQDRASALAAYNAGENRVDRWRAERPGLPRDEFIDDIPFPETQNYVKRIIGTTEDYRLLYGSRADAR
ncbi:MAG: hypothetical protein ABS36_19370 [Acidobacteria bacterium SCN 69-37]|nr:MAG: hypothetical protein ABS36_19370 [Acidobacteria bacterium SCN 69-37]